MQISKARSKEGVTIREKVADRSSRSFPRRNSFLDASRFNQVESNVMIKRTKQSLVDAAGVKLKPK